MKNTRFENAFKALEALEDSYRYWTLKVTDTSVQLSFALIAANWAVHGQDLKELLMPRISVSLAFLSLLATLIGAARLSYLLDKQHDYAETKPTRWHEEWLASQNAISPWPYTKKIEASGSFYRWLRLLFVLAGCIALGISFV